MFFFAFASSIRVFTLFLNLLDSEIIVIPFIIFCAIIFCFIKKQNLKHFLKYLLIWLLWYILAIWVVFFHLNLKNPDYAQQFIWIKNTGYTTPERNVFNDFVRISDTQKYHKYYVETQEWKTYLLNSEKDYHIWDILYLSATEKDLDFSNIFSSTGNTIFSNEFWN